MALCLFIIYAKSVSVKHYEYHKKTTMVEKRNSKVTAQTGYYLDFQVGLPLNLT